MLFTWRKIWKRSRRVRVVERALDQNYFLLSPNTPPPSLPSQTHSTTRHFLCMTNWPFLSLLILESPGSNGNVFLCLEFHFYLLIFREEAATLTNYSLSDFLLKNLHGMLKWDTKILILPTLLLQLLILTIIKLSIYFTWTQIDTKMYELSLKELEANTNHIIGKKQGKIDKFINLLKFTSFDNYLIFSLIM